MDPGRLLQAGLSKQALSGGPCFSVSFSCGVLVVFLCVPVCLCCVIWLCCFLLLVFVGLLFVFSLFCCSLKGECRLSSFSVPYCVSLSFLHVRLFSSPSFFPCLWRAFLCPSTPSTPPSLQNGSETPSGRVSALKAKPSTPPPKPSPSSSLCAVRGLWHLRGCRG